MPEALVLCYHALSPEWPSPLAVRPDQFARQLDHLLRLGFTGATFSELLRPAQSPGQHRVAVTFDDAYVSVLDHAMPVLASRGMPATVFVPTDYVSHKAPLAWPSNDKWLGSRWEAQLACLSWYQLAHLAGLGWEIGSHTCTHPHLTSLTEPQIAHELRTSKAVCQEQLNVPCSSIAYPYSAYDARVTAAARAAGYLGAATVPAGLLARSKASPGFEFPRVAIYRGDGDVAFRIRISRLTKRLRRFHSD